MDISAYTVASVALPISSGVAPPVNRNTSLDKEAPLFLGNTLRDREKVLRGRVMVLEKVRDRGGGGSMGWGEILSGGKKISLAKMLVSLFNRW